MSVAVFYFLLPLIDWLHASRARGWVVENRDMSDARGFFRLEVVEVGAEAAWTKETMRSLPAKMSSVYPPK